MKNFDEAREVRASQERMFVIGGQEFVYRIGVPPEVLLPFFEMKTGEAETLDAVLGITRPLSQREQLTVYDDTVLAFLVPGQEDKWKAARDPDLDNPLTLHDIGDLIEWLIEEQAARPTVPSVDSSPGSANGTTGTRPTVESLQPVEPVSD